MNMDRVAIVLAGGGARGAYEAGALRFVLDTLPRRAGLPVAYDMLCGTSAGALNAAFLGADSSRANELGLHWRNLTVEQVYAFDASALLRSPTRILGRGRGYPALLDTRPSERWIRSVVDWPKIHAALDRGDLDAFVVGATEVRNGRSVWFVDGAHGSVRLESDNPAIVYRRARIGAEHVRASSSIPLLFPPVDVDGTLMLDGGLRQNTPIAPALRLGASRVLVVHTQQAFAATSDVDPPSNLGLASLLGKALNALMLDPVERDLGSLRMVNDVLALGEDTYGQDHIARLNAHPSRQGRSALRSVDALLLRPSEDVGRIAAAVWAEGRIRAPTSTRYLLDFVARNEDEDCKDLLAYILFDHHFTAVLEALGHADAMAREEEIARFLRLGDDVQDRAAE